MNFFTSQDHRITWLRGWLAAVIWLAGPAAAWTQIYVANYGGTTVGEYNLSTGAPINASLVTGVGNPWGVVVAGNNLYVVNTDTNSIGEYNASTGAVINANFITGLNEPEGLALVGNILFVANTNGFTIGAYNASTGALLNFSVTGLSGPVGLAVAGNTLYVTDNTTGMVGAYNTSNGATINASLVTGLANPGFLAVSGNTLYVTDGTVVGTYNATTGATINANFMTGINRPDALAIVGNTLYVANRVANTVAEYNASTGALINANFITGLNVPYNLTVAVPAPSGLTYAANPAVYSLGIAIPANPPSSAGGAVVTYSVSPALPSGLVLDAASGIISGAPTATAAATNFTVTAWNNAGSATAVVRIVVGSATGGTPPSALTYPASSATYSLGFPISPNTPTNSGGAATAYSISPELPPGLTLNAATGMISGTPTAAASASNYTVTAANRFGSTTATLNITVKDLPPSALAYSSNPAVYNVAVTIPPNSPSSAGSPVLYYGVDRTLPAGLTLNAGTGVISGTPSAASGSFSYTVTALNAAGSTTAQLNIAVHNAPPSTLTYSANPVVYTLGRPISNNLPGSTGGPVSSYSVSPGLPTGLSLNTTTGVISGTPTAISASSNFTVTATNDGGFTTATLNLAVVSPMDGWRQQYFGTTANTGVAADTADPFHTGVSNLLAFAFFGPNQSPALANVSLLPQIQMSGGNLFFSFTQPAGVTGVIYGAEWTTAVDSGNWQSIPDTGTGNVHTFSEPIGNNTQIFLRLTVTNP